MVGTRDYDNVAVTESDQSLSVVETPSQELDSPSQGQETTWVNSNWTTYNGYYRQNQGGSKAAIKKFAMWIVGKGYKADKATTTKLGKIKGNGKDTFDSIIENALRIKKINGDSFAEIIKDTRGRLINLKPLNPGSTQVVANSKGMIVGYEQLNQDGKVIGKRFDVKNILHLCNDRDGDEIHGVSVYEGSTKMLDSIQQLDNDMAIVFHRYVMPLMIFKLTTDKATEIAKYKAQLKESLNTGQSLIIPKDAVDADTFQIPQFATLNPLDWRKEWKSEAIKDLGIPELVLGSADGTVDASAKMVYLAFQQTIEDEQRELEQQLKSQLGIDIDFNFPARIEENLGEDEGKDGDINTTKKSEVQVTSIKKDGKNPSNSTTKATL